VPPTAGPRRSLRSARPPGTRRGGPTPRGVHRANPAAPVSMRQALAHPKRKRSHPSTPMPRNTLPRCLRTLARERWVRTAGPLRHLVCTCVRPRLQRDALARRPVRS
jgi:hypothetical protein